MLQLTITVLTKARLSFDKFWNLLATGFVGFAINLGYYTGFNNIFLGSFYGDLLLIKSEGSALFFFSSGDCSVLVLFSTALGYYGAACRLLLALIAGISLYFMFSSSIMSPLLSTFSLIFFYGLSTM